MTSLQDYWWNWNGLCSTNSTNDSTHHVWNFPWSICLRVGSWCQCIWFGFLGPKSILSINQEKLCGFWKHVSLSGFFPLISSWSLLLCRQTHTTKLPDEKNWSLRKENQRCLDHQSFHEFSVLEIWRVAPFLITLIRVSVSVELCETEVCSLQIHLIGKCMTSKTHALGLLLYSQILLRHFPWRTFWNQPLLGN